MPLSDVSALLKEVYGDGDFFIRQLKEEARNRAILKGWKRERTYGREKWRFSRHAKLGQFFQRCGVYRQLDFIRGCFNFISISYDQSNLCDCDCLCHYYKKLDYDLERYKRYEKTRPRIEKL